MSKLAPAARVAGAGAGASLPTPERERRQGVAHFGNDGCPIRALDVTDTDMECPEERSAEGEYDEDNSRKHAGEGVRRHGKNINKRDGHRNGPFAFTTEALEEGALRCGRVTASFAVIPVRDSRPRGSARGGVRIIAPVQEASSHGNCR